MPEGPGEEAPRPGEGLRLLGVVREGPAEDPSPEGLVRWGDVAAVLYPGTLEVERVDPEEVRAHHLRLDALLQRVTVVPAPYGVAFRQEREVERFLRVSHEALLEALTLLDGRWELRVHAAPGGEEVAEALALDLAGQAYGELRSLAQAAIPFPRTGPEVLSAAFLVERTATRRFLDRVEELDREHPELSLRATGPWPAYDFVAMRPSGK